MIDDKVLGKRVRELRKDMGWTQKELAERAHISQSEVSKIETGQVTGLQDDTICKVINAFPVSPEFLAHGTRFASLFEQLPSMPPNDFDEAPLTIAYFASALTGLLPAQEAEMRALDERVHAVLRRYSAYPLALYRPREKTSPTENREVSAKAVYEIDREHVTCAGLMILAAIYPSLGAGMELQIALQSCKTVILLSRKDQEVSRMVLGCPAAVERIEYSGLSDLESQLIVILDKVMPQLTKSRFLNPDPDQIETSELGGRIRRLRTDRHLEPDDLARIVGVGSAYIEARESKPERIVNPSLSILRRISRALLTSETYLISGQHSLDATFHKHHAMLQTYADEIRMPVPDCKALWSEHYEEYRHDLSYQGVANRADVGDRKYWIDRHDRFRKSQSNGDLFSAAKS